MIEESCNIDDRGSSCCSQQPQKEEINFKDHWDKAYTNSPEEKLGWYETDLSPTLSLVSKAGLKKSARILNVGAGNTTLIDELLAIGYSDLIATDLSEVALNKLENRVGERKVECIVDDLTKPNSLYKISPVDLWIDRAVLHFFTEKKDQDVYFNLLKSSVKINGFVLLSEFNLNGAKVCSGLPVHRYSKDMIANKLGADFELIDSFNHTYIMPSGDERPYVYTLFKKRVSCLL